ncbi:MAG: amidohydrolase [Clostridia bacterium]|nr:amidohydrolase [Clostridia bacterium]
MPEVIDFHCHVFPEAVAAKATNNVGNYYGINMHGKGLATELENFNKSFPVKGFVIHSSATTPHQVEHVNDFIADYVKKDDCFIGFGTIHPGYENYKKEIYRIKALGLKGIKFHPDFQGFKIDDPEMFPIYDFLAAQGLPALFHVGDEHTDNSTPQAMASVLDMFPNFTVIAAHMGGFSKWDEAEKCLYGKNVYFDTSSTVIRISHEHLRELIYEHGVDKILFGSDYPVQTTKEAYEDMLKLGLPEEDLEKILHKNAEKLLGL